MAQSLAEQVYRCLICGHTWKGARIEVVVNDWVQTPQCPKCGGQVVRA